eukprot:TRINITY_DN2999_c0_g1_i1.p1 TRINITY_DN2999_c0_g1~~TRINITY_DN2999_c0_g1_i1.p1  ORF type:complete len:142 (-),score=49.09 TRINITY_DN2999_c0_g1_i1:13-438(-)
MFRRFFATEAKNAASSSSSGSMINGKTIIGTGVVLAAAAYIFGSSKDSKEKGGMATLHKEKVAEKPQENKPFKTSNSKNTNEQSLKEHYDIEDRQKFNANHALNGEPKPPSKKNSSHPLEYSGKTEDTHYSHAKTNDQKEK